MDNGIFLGPQQTNEAFNLGCDARIQGKSLKDNPYLGQRDSVLSEYWRWGWQDVNKFWGIWSKKPVKKLPKVRED